MMVFVEKIGVRCFSSHLVSRTEGMSMYGKALVLPPATQSTLKN